MNREGFETVPVNMSQMHHSRKLWGGLAGGLILALVAPASMAVGHSSHPVGEASHPDVGALFGTVTDPDGNPVDGVCLRAEERWYPYREVEYARTSGGGHYFFESLRPTAHVLRINPNCAGSDVVGRFASEWYDGATLRDDATPLRITANETTLALVTLRPSGGIGIDVTDDLGASVTTCARVYPGTQRAFDVSAPDRMRPGDRAIVARGRVLDGTARIGRLAPGSYRLLVGCFSDDGYEAPAPFGYLPQWTAPIEVGAGTDAEVTVELPRAGAIAGRVTDQFGRSLSGWVTTYQTSTRIVDGDWGTSGGYTTGRLAPGTYRLRAEGYARNWYDDYYGYWHGGSFSEWFEDAASFGEATPIEVVAGEASIANLDVVVVAPDVAVTDLQVVDQPIRTSLTDLPGTGIRKDITATIEELAGVEVSYLRYLAYAESVQVDGRRLYQTLDVNSFALAPGGKRVFEYEFATPGALGDVTFHVEACSFIDADRSNDRAKHRSFIGVGGLGGVVVGTGYPYLLPSPGYWSTYRPSNYYC